MAFRLLTTFGMLLLMLLGGCSDSGDAQTAHPQPDPNRFTLDIIDANRTITVQKNGEMLDITGVDTPIIVFDLFATWCSPCRAELPYLTTLQQEFNRSVTIIGISIEADKDDDYYRQFAEANRIGIPLVNTDDNMRFAQQIAVTAGVGPNFPIPLIAVYHRGRFVKYYSGLIPEEMLVNDFKQITKEN